jgi:hypothetical protein
MHRFPYYLSQTEFLSEIVKKMKCNLESIERKPLESHELLPSLAEYQSLLKDMVFQSDGAVHTISIANQPVEKAVDKALTIRKQTSTTDKYGKKQFSAVKDVHHDFLVAHLLV